MPVLRRVAAALVALVLLKPALVEAASTDVAQLNQLFAELKAAPDSAKGRDLERQIVQMWLRSGDPEVDQLMQWAVTAMSIESYTLALSYLDSVVVAAPQFAEGWNKRATVYFYLGHDSESLADIERTLALEPRYFGAFAGLGMIKLRQGKDEEALDAFKRALAIDPNLDDIKSQMFLLEDKLGRKI